jgi:hypothetical protein
MRPRTYGRDRVTTAIRFDRDVHEALKETADEVGVGVNWPRQQSGPRVPRVGGATCAAHAGDPDMTGLTCETADGRTVTITPPEQLSADRCRTITNKPLLARGVHPILRLPLAGNGHTCGDCANHIARRFNKTYHKCRLNDTAGPATDLRVSWPACTRWEATEE